MMDRPEYCPCDNDHPDPCPACGARVGYDACRALNNRKAPEPNQDSRSSDYPISKPL